jgi:hypothetical protein
LSRHSAATAEAAIPRCLQRFVSRHGRASILNLFKASRNTVTTDEVADGTNTVSIGYHYVPVLVPVAITQQPVSVTMISGGNATFSVTVNAISTPPLSYQWYFNSGVLSNATSATLALTNVQPGQAGTYSVVVTNVAGNVTSSNAVLTVNVPPIITQQPQSQTVFQGTNVTFSVTVSTNSTPPLSYKWYFNSSVLANATNATLTLTGVTTNQAGNYSVRVGNIVTTKVTSSNAVLTVNVPVPVAITQQPVNVTTNVGGNATFSVTVSTNSTTPLSYQWYFNSGLLTNATSATLTLTGVTTNQAGNYSVVVANVAGSVTSSNAVLMVNVPPVITTQPTSQTVIQGTNVTFGVTVSASSTPPLSYQWYFNNTNLIAGATNTSLTLMNVQPTDAGNYSVIVTNVAGSVTSSNAIFTVMSWTVDSDYDGVSDAQEIVDGTDPFNPDSVFPIRLGYWRFDDTNAWVGDAGQLPLLATNIVGVPSWNTNAALIDSTNPAILTYRDVETNGNANINCRQGTVRFWFKPDWSSPNSLLTDQGIAGRLIEMGNYNPAFTNGWWALYLNFDRNQLSFGSSTNGGGTTNLSSSIYWISNQWHQVILTYTPKNSLLYLDGQFAAIGTGSIYFPNVTERANGFRIGSDVNGNNQAQGTFDELETFNYPISAAWIWNDYTNFLALQPSILTQPTNQTVIVGETATFTVVAGSSLPLSYQWYFNSTALTDATSATLTLNNVQTNNAGNYFVVVADN